MAQVITGSMRNDSIRDRADYKGSVILELSGGSPKGNSIIPGCLNAVRETATNRLIPAESVTVHIPSFGLVTADVAVYLDGHGEIIYDLADVAKCDGVPATFPFLVSHMRIL